MPRWLLPVVAVALAAVVGLTTPGAARAHPLGSSIINRYGRVDLYGDTVRLTYVLDYGWMATVDILSVADRNRDGMYSPDELQLLLDGVQTNYGYGLRLHVGGKALEFENRTSALLQRNDVNGFPTLKLTFIYDAPIPAGLAGPVPGEFEDLNFEDNAVWKEMTVFGSPGAVFTTPDEFKVEVSAQLDSYPPLDAVTVPAQDKANWTWTAGTGLPAPRLQRGAPPPGFSSRSNSPLPVRGPTPVTTVVATSEGLTLDWRLPVAVVAGVVAFFVIHAALRRLR